MLKLPSYYIIEKTRKYGIAYVDILRMKEENKMDIVQIIDELEQEFIGSKIFYGAKNHLSIWISLLHSLLTLRLTCLRQCKKLVMSFQKRTNFK